MLKHTRKIWISYIDMVMFIERGIRGDLSQYSNRYARANNKHAVVRSIEIVDLMYFDVNNLVGQYVNLYYTPIFDGSTM